MFGYYILGGLLIGAVFGSVAAGPMRIGISAMACAFLGWFIAAAVLEQRKKEEK